MPVKRWLKSPRVRRVAITVGGVAVAAVAFAVVLPSIADYGAVWDVLKGLTWEQGLLLVEDEPEVAAFLRDLFELDGWVVDIVPNGRRALEALHGRDYRVIVSDLVMPELDGAELYREVARWQPALLPRFIFISGFADTDTAAFIRQTRAPMISKPFRFDEIRQAIADYQAGRFV